MRVVNFINSKIKKINETRPRWAITIYNKLPESIKAKVFNKFKQNRVVSRVNHLKKLVLFPLDSAWGEAIFAPFHDPVISPTLPVEFIPINAHGCKIDYFWCYTILIWDSSLPNTDAASFQLVCNIDVADYNNILFCLTMPPDVSLRLEIQLDGKRQTLEREHSGTGKRMEIMCPITGKILDDVKLIFKSSSPFVQRINISWFGLQASELVTQMRKHRQKYDPKWPGLIKPVDEWGKIRFEMGMLFSEFDLENLRQKKKLPGWDEHFRQLEEKAHQYLVRQPERDIGDYLPLDDVRYIREFETGKTPYYFEALVLGFVGLINQDESMMFHALRYLMCMLHTKYWAQSAESRLPGSTWDQRCFLEEMTTNSVSLLFDWFGFALTGRAKELIRQSIYDKGLAVIERDMMKYEYLYHINQGAVFCRARILGGLHLERSWPRTGKYVERAFSDMTRCLKNYIEKDGGSHEGIGYFCQTLQAVLPAMIAYTRSRNKNPKAYIRKYFSNCDNYVAAMSGSVPGTAIPEGDCRINYFCGDAIPVLAGFFPDKVFKNILGSCIKSGSVFSVTGTLSNSGGILGFIYGPDYIPKSECIAPTFSILKKTGHLVSYRKNNHHAVRFHLTGSKPIPSHSHFDKGAIALEVDNIPLLIDRGMIEYYYSDAYELKRSYMHNVITPLLPDMTYPDQSAPNRPVISSGRGDNWKLEAFIDLKNVWRNHMHSCSRSIRSNAPDEFRIVDKGELKEQGRITFNLHSIFPFEIKSDNQILLITGNITLTIEPKWGEEVLQRQHSVNLKHKPVYHLSVIGPVSRQFTYETGIHISWNDKQATQKDN